MRNLSLPVLALAGLAFLAFPKATMSDAQPGKLGIGLELGDPTGINMKYWLTGRAALDFVVGWNSWGYNNSDYYGYYYGDGRCNDGNFYNNNRPYCQGVYNRHGENGWSNFHFHIDYLVHRFDVIRASVPIPLYFGGGVQYEYRRWWGDQSWIGGRGTVGIAIMPRTIPFDFFFELAPVLYILPGPDFDVNGGIGARFWF